MKAVVVREQGKLVVETIPDPTPEPGELVLRVSACGISGTDRIGLDDVPEAFRALAKPDSQCKLVAYPG